MAHNKQVSCEYDSCCRCGYGMESESGHISYYYLLYRYTTDWKNGKKYDEQKLEIY